MHSMGQKQAGASNEISPTHHNSLKSWSARHSDVTTMIKGKTEMRKFKTKEHTKPRCSVNKLGEYVAKQSSPARRREIIKTQKIPPTYNVVTYTPATREIVTSILTGFDEEHLIESIGDFFQKAEEADSEFDKRQAKCCHDALRAFKKILPNLEAEDCTILPGPQTWSIEIGGVTVSIRPELLLEVDKGKSGFIKLYLSKSYRLDDHSAGVIAAVIAEKAISAGMNISRRHIQIIDVFGQRIYKCPAHTKRLFREAEAACEEIAFNWRRFSAS
ncbi:MAG: hypothetical protein AB7M93_30715 [Candidatus Obscuribacterales bacterium]